MARVMSPLQWSTGVLLAPNSPPCTVCAICSSPYVPWFISSLRAAACSPVCGLSMAPMGAVPTHLHCAGQGLLGRASFLSGRVHSLLCPVSEVKFCQCSCTSCDNWSEYHLSSQNPGWPWSISSLTAFSRKHTALFCFSPPCQATLWEICTGRQAWPRKMWFHSSCAYLSSSCPSFPPPFLHSLTAWTCASKPDCRCRIFPWKQKLTLIAKIMQM